MKASMLKSIISVGIAACCLLPGVAFGQPEIVKHEGVTSALHKANVGRIAFIAKHSPADSLSAADFLQSFEMKETGALAMRGFMRTSLTNYLHRLAPEMSADELAQNGNYQVSYFVDGTLVHKENLHPGRIAAETKHTKTVFAATIMNSANPKAPWGALWHFFLLEGGHQALTPGKHRLRVEL